VDPGLADQRSRQQHLRDAAGEAGVDLVIKHLETELREHGWRIEKMPEKNKGYDILVRDADDEPRRYIEVKTTEGAWGLRGVGLTDPQFSRARQERERYWLYVVEDLYQPEAHLWWIQDPAGRVDYFHYDHGWQAAAQGHASTSGAPVSGPLPDDSALGAIAKHRSGKSRHFRHITITRTIGTSVGIWVRRSHEHPGQLLPAVYESRPCLR
jgi:hypothetical protein